jgi:DNA-3-methyladenine glycosylase II
MPSELRTATSHFTIAPRGPFSLREAAQFGFGQREAGQWDGAMRLAFCLDDLTTQVGVEARQDAEGVHFSVQGSGLVPPVRSQVGRVLSLADDATGFVEVAQRDPVVARLQAAAPGLRPQLFYSAYEAAAWSVLSSRRPAAQMAEVRRRLSEAHGATFTVAGQILAALPTPRELLAVRSFPVIPHIKLERLHGVARAALDGWLDTDRIRTTEPEAAMAELRRIPGIGPFYSSLIVIRAVGVRDVLPPDEPRARELAKHLYGLASVPTVKEFEALAEPWRPWRTWVVVLMRAAAKRVVS